jgi:hypothetical protein
MWLLKKRRVGASRERLSIDENMERAMLDIEQTHVKAFCILLFVLHVGT